MKTNSLFGEKTVLSLEVFPPKRTAPLKAISGVLNELQTISPDFISVTYGAGGSENCEVTFAIAKDIKERFQIESVAHLPCLNLKKEEVLNLLDELRALGIENILALRGDRIPDRAPAGDFFHASNLISFIREHGDFNLIGACYPEGHLEAGSLKEDLENLKIKADAGCSQLITQLFFDNDVFYSFRERASQAGIHLPISAGIMPATNKKQLERMTALCGATLPKKFKKAMEKYEDKPEALQDAGIAYAIDQIADLAAQGVEGIHLYTMNNPVVAKTICSAVRTLL